MCAPPEAEDWCFGELYLSLPPNWPVGDADEAAVWPLRALADLAGYPHEAETWLWRGHTVGAEDPAERITPGAGFTAWILGPHLSLGHDGCVFRHREKEIHVHSLLPIYREELELVIGQGPDALFRVLARAGVDDLVDIRRPNLVRRPPPGRRRAATSG
jgi:hypothetical protein